MHPAWHTTNSKCRLSFYSGVDSRKAWGDMPVTLWNTAEICLALETYLAGHYPVLKLEPPCWFHDSQNGMQRYFDQVMETVGI